MANQRCKWCGKDKLLEKNFDRNEFETNGYNSICKECKNNIKELDEFKLYLMDSGIKFEQNTWNRAEQIAKEKLLKKYKKGNLPINFNELVFKKTISIFFSIGNLNGSYKFSPTSNEDIKKSRIKLDNDTLIELTEKWGTGYSKDELIAFERKYNKLIRSYSEKTELHTEALKTYVRYRVKEEIATAKNEWKEAKEWGTLAEKAAAAAKINPYQMSKSDISGGIDVLSQLFEAVESEVGIIPLLPKLLEQPYDDADMIIWCIINYIRRLEDKPPVTYKEVYKFYDNMLNEHYKQLGYNQQQIEEFLKRRNNVFRDMEQIYIEPLYTNSD